MVQGKKNFEIHMWHNKKKYYQQSISVKTLQNFLTKQLQSFIINEKCLDSSQAYGCLQAWADAPYFYY